MNDPILVPPHFVQNAQKQLGCSAHFLCTSTIFKKIWVKFRFMNFTHTCCENRSTAKEKGSTDPENSPTFRKTKDTSDLEGIDTIKLEFHKKENAYGKH